MDDVKKHTVPKFQLMPAELLVRERFDRVERMTSDFRDRVQMWANTWIPTPAEKVKALAAHANAVATRAIPPDERTADGHTAVLPCVGELQEMLLAFSNRMSPAIFVAVLTGMAYRSACAVIEKETALNKGTSSE